MRKQSRQELDKWYDNEDPWGYKKNPDDVYRMGQILSWCCRIRDFSNKSVSRVLDIGCGEGFITNELCHVFTEAAITGMDISQKALDRCSDKIIRVCANLYEDDLYWIGRYDVVIATGVLYGAENKDIDKVISFIRPGGYLLLCHINEWRYNREKFFDRLTYLDMKTFKYRQFHEEMFIFHKSKEA